MSQRHVANTQAIVDVERSQIALNFVPTLNTHEDSNFVSFAVQALNIVSGDGQTQDVGMPRHLLIRGVNQGPGRDE